MLSTQIRRTRMYVGNKAVKPQYMSYSQWDGSRQSLFNVVPVDLKVSCDDIKNLTLIFLINTSTFNSRLN